MTPTGQTKRICLMVAASLLVPASGVALARPIDLLAPEFRINFATIYDYARLASDTYEGTSTIRDQHPGVSWIATPGHAHVLYFIQQDNRRHTQTIAIRGTVDSTNWSLNMDTKAYYDKHAGIHVHRGFDIVAQSIYADLKPRLKPGYTINLTGHSLGGAVACILATYLVRDGYLLGKIYTFGQPKFTGAQGAQKYWYLPLVRVVNQNDIVALLPDDFADGKTPLAHLGPELLLLAGDHYSLLMQADAYRRSLGALGRYVTQSSVPDHKMKWYLSSLKQKLEGAKEVPFAKRHLYIARHRAGTAANYEKVQKKGNFGSRYRRGH